MSRTARPDRGLSFPSLASGPAHGESRPGAHTRMAGGSTEVLTEIARDQPTGPLSLGRLLTFSLANLPTGAMSIAVFVYLPPYFASHLGVAMSLVGAAWFAARMVDIPVDVILAVLMDRTRTPIGRYRAWMIAGAPFLMLGLYELFMAPRGFGGLYLTGWLLVMYLGYSMVYLSTSAWGATMAAAYHERSRLFGGLTALGVIGALSVLMIPILGRSMGLSDARGVQWMGWYMVGVIPLTIGIAAARTPERLARDHKAERFPLRDYWAVFTNPALLRLFLAQMALTLGPGWMSAIYIFFFTRAWGFTQEQASILLALYIVAQVPGALATSAIARRIGKHRTLMFTTTAFSLGILSIFFTPKANLPAAIPILVWSGAMASGFGLMVNAMLADVGDEIHLSQGRSRTSLIYALNALAAKIAAAFSILLTYPLLQALGFNAAEGGANTPAALWNLTMAFIAGPIVFVMLGGACVIGWRIDARRQAEVRGALDAREAALDSAVSVTTS